MKGDDDDDDDGGAIGVARYPCLPSLVALQQMRNRLHLAHVGRKLMKWTALATGRELRKIAAGLIEVHQNYSESFRSAYIQLARCRYFYPNLNMIVVGNPPKYPQQASVTVTTLTRSVTGCRVVEFDILDSNIDPYAHLAMDKGGQAVADAKKMWRDLLKKVIRMLQLQSSYTLADMSHKSAHKKWNVLSKIVIPRTEKSIKYILDELEERDREEFFRMKKILQVKAKVKKVKTDAKEKLAEGLKPKEPPVDVPPPAEKPLEKTPEKALIKIPPEPPIVAKPPIVAEPPTVAKPPVVEVPLVVKPDIVKDEKCIVCSRPLKGKVEPIKNIEESKQKLREYKSHIDQIVSMTNDINKQGIVQENFKDFLATAEVLRNKIVEKEKELQQLKEEKPVPLDAPIDKLCPTCIERLKKQLEKEDKALVKPAEELGEAQGNFEYGIFETDYKEITKIIKTRNEDGTITEERKMIRVKKETRTPGTNQQIMNLSESSPAESVFLNPNRSKTENDSTKDKTVGLAFVQRTVMKKAHSVLIVPRSPTEQPSRCCVSDCSELSFLDCEKISSDNRCMNTSLTDSEKILKSHDPDAFMKDDDSFISDISDF